MAAANPTPAMLAMMPGHQARFVDTRATIMPLPAWVKRERPRRRRTAPF
jgi:hypothetical protein